MRKKLAITIWVVTCLSYITYKLWSTLPKITGSIVWIWEFYGLWQGLLSTIVFVPVYFLVTLFETFAVLVLAAIITKILGLLRDWEKEND